MNCKHTQCNPHLLIGGEIRGNHRREAQIFLVETGRVIQTAFPYRCMDFVAITFFTQQVVHLQCYFSCNSFLYQRLLFRIKLNLVSCIKVLLIKNIEHVLLSSKPFPHEFFFVFISYFLGDDIAKKHQQWGFPQFIHRRLTIFQFVCSAFL